IYSRHFRGAPPNRPRLPAIRARGCRWRAGRVASVDISSFPKCVKCKAGDLVPLSDFGSQGAAIHFKAWACTNPECGFNIKIRNGAPYIDEPTASGPLHTPRVRYHL